jgi:NitT/TauT family transport system ATP-binding protein
MGSNSPASLVLSTPASINPNVVKMPIGSRITIDNVSQVFKTNQGDRYALDRISLSVEPNEFVTLLGPSGCGKSTLLSFIAGLATPTQGQVIVDGAQVQSPYPSLGMVFQEPYLLEWRNILSNVLLGAQLKGRAVKQMTPRALDLMKRVGLSGFEKYYPHELSGGMRQRAAICRALLHDPGVLLMDEPFGALDALTRDDINIELQDLWMRSPKTVVFVTHSISEAIFLSDRIFVMSPRPGRIAEVIDIDLPRPRDLNVRDNARFSEYSRHIRAKFAELGVLHHAPGAKS